MGPKIGSRPTPLVEIHLPPFLGLNIECRIDVDNHIINFDIYLGNESFDDRCLTVDFSYSVWAASPSYVIGFVEAVRNIHEGLDVWKKVYCTKIML